MTSRGCALPFLAVTDLSLKRQDKFRAYRARKRAAGFRELRMWIPDLDSPVFRAEAARQAALADQSEEEREISDFMEAAGAEAWREAD